MMGDGTAPKLILVVTFGMSAAVSSRMLCSACVAHQSSCRIFSNQFAQEVHHDAGAWRQVAPRGIDDGNRKSQRRKIDHQRYQPSLAYVVLRNEMGQKCDAQPIQSGTVHSRGIIRSEAAGYGNRHVAVRGRKPPDIVVSPAVIDDAVM